MSLHNESGRLTTEIIGALVIMMLLSVGTILIYNHVMLEQQANSLFQDFKMRSALLKEHASNKKHLFSIAEVGTMKRLGGTVVVKLDDPAPGFYTITTFYLKTKLCKKLLAKNWASIGATQVYIDDVVYANQTDTCQSDVSSIKIVFKSAYNHNT